MVRPICDWWYDLYASRNRRWEVLNMFKNLAETDFASAIVHHLSDKSGAVSAISVQLSAFWIVHWLYNLVVSLVWLMPNMFKNLIAIDFAITIVYDLCDQSHAVSVIHVRFSQFWIVH